MANQNLELVMPFLRRTFTGDTIIEHGLAVNIDNSGPQGLGQGLGFSEYRPTALASHNNLLYMYGATKHRLYQLNYSGTPWSSQFYQERPGLYQFTLGFVAGATQTLEITGAESIGGISAMFSYDGELYGFTGSIARHINLTTKRFGTARITQPDGFRAGFSNAPADVHGAAIDGNILYVVTDSVLFKADLTKRKGIAIQYEQVGNAHSFAPRPEDNAIENKARGVAVHDNKIYIVGERARRTIEVDKETGVGTEVRPFRIGQPTEWGTFNSNVSQDRRRTPGIKMPSGLVSHIGRLIMCSQEIRVGSSTQTGAPIYNRDPGLWRLN